jgi:hypothetical protein
MTKHFMAITLTELWTHARAAGDCPSGESLLSVCAGAHVCCRPVGCCCGARERAIISAAEGSGITCKKKRFTYETANEAS